MSKPELITYSPERTFEIRHHTVGIAQIMLDCGELVTLTRIPNVEVFTVGTCGDMIAHKVVVSYDKHMEAYSLWDGQNILVVPEQNLLHFKGSYPIYRNKHLPSNWAERYLSTGEFPWKQ